MIEAIWLSVTGIWLSVTGIWLSVTGIWLSVTGKPSIARMIRTSQGVRPRGAARITARVPFGETATSAWLSGSKRILIADLPSPLSNGLRKELRVGEPSQVVPE